ncbi:hypothetical protein RJT34_31854 [Clitoria ternatea]|uniref:Uncharacterized protein n=1 Tax=Clitoria ternatea TaxID=43366 RepID=A0AAN9I1Q7_CLITE
MSVALTTSSSSSSPLLCPHCHTHFLELMDSPFSSQNDAESPLFQDALALLSPSPPPTLRNPTRSLNSRYPLFALRPRPKRRHSLRRLQGPKQLPCKTLVPRRLHHSLARNSRHLPPLQVPSSRGSSG